LQSYYGSISCSSLQLITGVNILLFLGVMFGILVSGNLLFILLANSNNFVLDNLVHLIIFHINLGLCINKAAKNCG
jgi:hypothetical protein